MTGLSHIDVCGQLEELPPLSSFFLYSVSVCREISNKPGFSSLIMDSSEK